MCVYLWLLMTSLHMSRWQHVLVPYTVCVAVSGEFGLRRLNPAVVIERIRKGVKRRNNKREGDFQCPFPSRRAPDVSTLLSFYNGNMRYFFQNWLTMWPSLIYMHRVKFHLFEWIAFSTSTMCVLIPAQNIKYVYKSLTGLNLSLKLKRGLYTTWFSVKFVNSNWVTTLGHKSGTNLWLLTNDFLFFLSFSVWQYLLKIQELKVRQGPDLLQSLIKYFQAQMKYVWN